MKGAFRSASTTSSSASRGWRGKAAGLDLQALRAQVRKLRVSSFMVAMCFVLVEAGAGYTAAAKTMVVDGLVGRLDGSRARVGGCGRTAQQEVW